VTDTANIFALSNIAGQLFEHMYDHQFRVIPEATAAFFTKQFSLLLPICFLSRLSSLRTIHDGANSFELTQADAMLFWSLQAYTKFVDAMKLSCKRTQADDD
jgi:hypothetical protein